MEYSIGNISGSSQRKRESDNDPIGHSISHLAPSTKRYFSSIKVTAKGFIGEIVEQRESLNRNKVHYYLNLRLLMGHAESDHLALTVRAVDSLNPFLERILRTQACANGARGNDVRDGREGREGTDGADEEVTHSLSRLLVDLTLIDVVFRQPDSEHQEAVVTGALLSDITL